MAQYRVVAHTPTAGSGSSFDKREVGPFTSRARAEDAAARLVDDPRRWAKIIIDLDPEPLEDEDDE